MNGYKFTAIANHVYIILHNWKCCVTACSIILAKELRFLSLRRYLFSKWCAHCIFIIVLSSYCTAAILLQENVDSTHCGKKKVKNSTYYYILCNVFHSLQCFSFFVRLNEFSDIQFVKLLVQKRKICLNFKFVALLEAANRLNTGNLVGREYFGNVWARTSQHLPAPVEKVMGMQP